MTISRLRPLAVAAVLALCAGALAIVLVAPAVGAPPSARAARARPRLRSCDISDQADRLGPTEVTSLKVAGVRCATGVSVVKAFHACRLKNGPSGRCVRLVKDYACMEQRTSGPTQFSALVTCRKRAKTVVHRYTQVL